MNYKKTMLMAVMSLIATIGFAAIDKTSGKYGYENSLDGTKVPGGYGDYTTTSAKPTAAQAKTQQFAQCKKLSSLDLSAVTEIGNAAFAYSAMPTLTIPANVTKVGYISFGGCTNLTSVTVKSWNWATGTTELLKKEPFRECTKLTTLAVPGGVPSIDIKSVFPSVTKIRCPKANVDAWKKAYPAFTIVNSDPILTIKNGVLTKVDLNGNTALTIPSTVKEIGSFAFFKMTDLQSVTIPESVEKIGEKAFKGCTGLTTLKIPSKVKSFANASFAECSNLKSINIPDGVTYLWGAQFENCSSLTSVTGMAGVTTIGNSAFAGCSLLQSVPLTNKIGKIGDYAFFNCYNFKNPKLPTALKSIGTKAFKNCISITSVSIPETVTTLGSAAFFGCTSLQAAYVPAKIAVVPNCCYQGCTALTKVKIYGATTIGDSCFATCSSLTSIDFGPKMQTIGAYAFMNCTSLVGVNVPNTVTSIGKKTFKGCKKLETITLSNKISIIPDELFNGCSSLLKVWSSGTIRSIGASAFKGCSKLVKVGDLTNDVLVVIKKGKSWVAPVKSIMAIAPAPQNDYLHGIFSDGSGEYNLMIDDDGTTGFACLAFFDGETFIGEVEVEVLDNLIIISSEIGTYQIIVD